MRFSISDQGVEAGIDGVLRGAARQGDGDPGGGAGVAGGVGARAAIEGVVAQAAVEGVVPRPPSSLLAPASPVRVSLKSLPRRFSMLVRVSVPALRVLGDAGCSARVTVTPAVAPA
jgi:hypothetical protein